jgi:hypothetical protein
MKQKTSTLPPRRKGTNQVKLPEFIVSGEGLWIPVAGEDLDGQSRNLDDTVFQLHFLCDVPILTFHFKNTWDVEVIPVHFSLFDDWPTTENLTIDLCLVTQPTSKRIILPRFETASILAARTEQQKMNDRQISAMIDLIYCGYFGFTEKPGVHT